MIELYQAEWCPYSRLVRQRLTELGLPYLALPVEAMPDDREEMRARTGHDVIPVLVDEDGSVINDAERIVEHLDSRYEEPPEGRRHRVQARAHGM